MIQQQTAIVTENVLDVLEKEMTAAAVIFVQGVQYTDVGLLFPGGDPLPFAEWSALFGSLWNMSTSIRFAIGDALVYGDHRYGEKYTQAIEATGYSLKRLQSYVWVSNKVPIVRWEQGEPVVHRVSQALYPWMTWTHHHAVSALSVPRQAYWLRQARDFRMTTRELKESVAHESPPPEPIEVPAHELPAGLEPAFIMRLEDLDGLKRFHIRQGQQTVIITEEDVDTLVSLC